MKRPTCPQCKMNCDRTKDNKGRFSGVTCWNCGYTGKINNFENRPIAVARNNDDLVHRRKQL